MVTFISTMLMFCPSTSLFLMIAGWIFKDCIGSHWRLSDTKSFRAGGDHLPYTIFYTENDPRVWTTTSQEKPTSLTYKFDSQVWPTSLNHEFDPWKWPREWPTSLTYVLDLYEISRNTFSMEAHQTTASE